MIGGQIIVPIRDANGNKVVISTTSVSLKPGTYAKLIRAAEMQKELVLEDLIIATGDNVYKAVSHSFPTAPGTGTGAPFRFVVYYKTQTQGTSTTVFITADDTAVIGS